MVAWLNLAAQPCLMAMEQAPEPATATAHMAHAGHSDSHHCDHCPPAMDQNYEACVSSAASACGVTPDYNNDARNKLPELKDIPTYVAIADLLPLVEFEFQKDFVQPPDQAGLHFPGGPSLNVRYCVYLK